jgi:hypothetical protein
MQGQTRICVKGLPKHLTDARFKTIFQEAGIFWFFFFFPFSPFPGRELGRLEPVEVNWTPVAFVRG